MNRNNVDASEEENSEMPVVRPIFSNNNIFNNIDEFYRLLLPHQAAFTYEATLKDVLGIRMTPFERIFAEVGRDCFKPRNFYLSNRNHYLRALTNYKVLYYLAASEKSRDW